MVSRPTSWASSSITIRRISSRSAAASGCQPIFAERAVVPVPARRASPVRGSPSRWLDATGYGGTGPAGACQGISPVKSPNGSARSLL